ncbi:MAG: Holliday junction branch migration protein RuvA [Deltaproteobacteria bacterium]|nr:Holliday junction branch migration protein RuvA [Deltaproteobacteria bacterium]
MIASLRGILISKNASSAVIECGGVGYFVAMSLTSLAKIGSEGSEVKVLVHTQLSQDALRLFGFYDAKERQIFEVLISINGVGPKLALALLSSLSPDELCSIVSRGDRLALTHVPGVGAKKADRLLLELKGKLPEPVAMLPSGNSTLHIDVQSALINLGFAPNIADKAARQALAENPDEVEIATLVRAALRGTRG